MYLVLNPEIIFNTNGEMTAGVFYNLKNSSRISIPNTFVPALCSLLQKKSDSDSIDFEKLGTHLYEIEEYIEENDVGKFYVEPVHIEPTKMISPFLLREDKLHDFTLSGLTVEITGKCNLNCCYCSETNDVYRTCGCKKWNSEELIQYDDYIELFVAAQRLGLRQVAFVGGEPLLRWELLQKLILYLSKANIGVQLHTNGSLITEDIAYVLKENKVIVCIEINSHTPELMIQMNNKGSELNDIQSGLTLLKELEVPIMLRLLVNKYNEDLLEEICQFYSSFGPIKRNYLYPPNDFFSRKWYNQSISIKQFDMKLNYLSYYIYQSHHNCLYGQIFVSSDGTVSPCIMIRDALGNILNTELWEIFKDGKHRLFWNTPKSSLEHCTECEYSPFCFDCRAINRYATGDNLGVKYCQRIPQETK